MSASSFTLLQEQVPDSDDNDTVDQVEKDDRLDRVLAQLQTLTTECAAMKAECVSTR